MSNMERKDEECGQNTRLRGRYPNFRYYSDIPLNGLRNGTASIELTRFNAYIKQQDRQRTCDVRI